MIVLAVILCVLLLILLLPVGVDARYDGDVLAQLAIGPIRIRLYPAKATTPEQDEKAERKKAEKERKKAEKAKKKRHKQDKPEEKPKTEEKPPKSLVQQLEEIMSFVRLGLDAVGSVFHKLKIKRLTIRAILGGTDPAKLGEDYGRIQAALSSLRPVLKHKFRVRRSEISVRPDFLSTKTTVEAELSLRFLVGDLLGIAIKYAIRALKLLLAQKRQEDQDLQTKKQRKKAVEL